MAENTAIEWCDHTFNPWTGCTKVGPGCNHCYAESWAKRSGSVRWGAGEPRRRTTAVNWRKPLQWDDNAAAFREEHGRRQRVFCASLADVFDNEVPPIWRVELLAKIAATDNLDWLLLTKRIGNAERMLVQALELAKEAGMPAMVHWLRAWLDGRPPAHVWLGATIVNQEEADRDVPKLLATPARVRFLSMEPLLGPVDLTAITVRRKLGVEVFSALYFDGDAEEEPDLGSATLDWIIAGGESGPGARPMHPDWARSLRDQCAAAGVPFLFKQWGEWAPDDGTGGAEGICRALRASMRGTVRIAPGDDVYRYGKKAAGRLLDGITHDAFPEVPRA